jgi:hypothetical protein
MGKICTKFFKRHRWKDGSAVGLEKMCSESVNWIQIVSLFESIGEPLISINPDMS